MPDRPNIISRTLAGFGRMLASFAKAEEIHPGPGWNLLDTSSVTPSGSYDVPPTQERIFRLYVENLWVFTAITTNARAIAGAPWHLKRWNESTGQGDVVTDHPMIDLLEKPYPGATYETLIQTINPHLDLAGNAYLEEVSSAGADQKQKRGPILELRPLLPTRMRMIVRPYEGVEKYIYTPNLNPTHLSPDEVIHFMLQDPRSEVNGIGPASAGWLTARIDQEALRWNAGFFARGATPGVVLETPEKIPAAERTRIVAEFDQKFGGTDKAHKTACLPYGLKATPFGQTMREMQFRELRKMTREEILAVFGTPPILAGILDGSSYSNAYLQLQIFRDYHVLPRLRYMFAMLTAALAPRYEDGAGLYLEPDVSEMRLPDEEDRELSRAVQLVNAKIIDVDEARTMIGLAPREVAAEATTGSVDGTASADGAKKDVTIFMYDQDNAIVTIDEIRGLKGLGPHPNREFGPLTVPQLRAKFPDIFPPGSTPGAPAAPPPAFGKSAHGLNGRAVLIAAHGSRGAGRTWFSRLAKTAPHLLAVERRRVVQVGGEGRQPASGTPARRSEFQKDDGGGGDEDGGGVNATLAKTVGADVPLTPWRLAKAKDAVVSRLEPRVQALLQARLDRQKAKVLALIRGKLRKADDSAPFVPITEQELRDAIYEPLVSALTATLEQGLQGGADSMAGALGVEFNVPDADVQAYLEERRTNLEDVLDEATARGVKDALKAGYDAGESEKDIMARIAEAGEFADSRAQRIARTELHAATQAGSHEQMKAAGIDQRQWIASPDERTRPAHQEASGQIRGIDEPFDVDGEELDYPGDPNGSPGNVISCRCVTLTIRSSDSGDDLAALLDRVDGDPDAVDQVGEAMRALPDDVVARADERAMGRLTVDRGKGDDAEYDADSRTLTVGPKARRRDVQDGVKEHLVSTVTTSTDARGFHNARRLSGLPDVGGKEDGPGTERERAVALVSRAATGDREGLESLVGRKLTDAEYRQFGVLSSNFWAGFGTKGPKPAVRR